MNYLSGTEVASALALRNRSAQIQCFNLRGRCSMAWLPLDVLTFFASVEPQRQRDDFLLRRYLISVPPRFGIFYQDTKEKDRLRRHVRERNRTCSAM